MESSAGNHNVTKETSSNQYIRYQNITRKQKSDNISNFCSNLRSKLTKQDVSWCAS
jgi:hypothetical protein